MNSIEHPKPACISVIHIVTREMLLTPITRITVVQTIPDQSRFSDPTLRHWECVFTPVTSFPIRCRVIFSLPNTVRGIAQNPSAIVLCALKWMAQEFSLTLHLLKVG